jgi:hypothetical protein
MEQYMDDKSKAFIVAGIITFFGIAGLIFLYIFPAGENDFYPQCMTNEWLGLYCPGCGTGRALSCLIRGDIASAFRLNPLLVMGLPLAVYYYVGCVLECFSIRLPYSKPNKHSVLAIIVLIVFYGVLRNIPIWPFNLLMPN